MMIKYRNVTKWQHMIQLYVFSHIPEMIYEYGQGDSLAFIGNRHGLDAMTVRKYLLMFGQSTRTRSRYHSNVDQYLHDHAEEIVKEYNMREYGNGVTTVTLAKKHNVGNSTMWNFLAKRTNTHYIGNEKKKRIVASFRDEEKMTFSMIGRELGISRQRVHQIYNS